MIFQIKDNFDNIINRHPEVEPYLEYLKETFRDPEIIVSNPYNSSEKYYHHYFEKLDNYIIVIIEQNKNFIITAYIGRKIKKGKIEWKKN